MTIAAPDKQVARLYPRKWTAVMAAAAGQHPNLLRLEGETLCLHAQVIPDTSDGKVRYHNDLMKACGLTLRELIAAMNKTTVRHLRSPSKTAVQNVPGMSDIGQPFRQRGMKIIKGENGIGAKNTNEAM